ncbi:MAG: hypothetical protein GKS06_20175 [Acidobacteria bacterium]|nr:hypothetical protein [Acidobacteriota bacterium]
MRKWARTSAFGMVVLALATPGLVVAQETELSTVASDGVTVFGETYFGHLDATAPLILLFHQADSNGRGEYGDLAPVLNEAGFRAVAWDLRMGGEVHGSVNRTLESLPPGTPNRFCDAYPDMVAALEYVLATELADEVIVWGSSFSSALIFHLAADHASAVSTVIGFSPPLGGPLEECRVRRALPRVAAPMAVFRPRSEMGYEDIEEQRRLLEDAGADFYVIEDGVHAASMLLDERTGHDMSETRALVTDWLWGAIERGSGSDGGEDEL